MWCWQDWESGLASSPDGCLMASRPTAYSPGTAQGARPLARGLEGLGGRVLANALTSASAPSHCRYWLELVHAPRGSYLGEKGIFLGRGQWETRLMTDWVHLRLRFGGQPLSEDQAAQTSCLVGAGHTSGGPLCYHALPPTSGVSGGLLRKWVPHGWPWSP